jgi:hypothetical protein
MKTVKLIAIIFVHFFNPYNSSKPEFGYWVFGQVLPFIFEFKVVRYYFFWLEKLITNLGV